MNTPLLNTQLGKILRVDLPEPPYADAYDERAIVWFGYRAYIGGRGRVRSLFDILMGTMPKTYTMRDLGELYDGGSCESWEEDEKRKMSQRIRQDVSRLRKALQEPGPHGRSVYDHVLIHTEFRDNDYTVAMMLRNLSA